MYVPCILLLRIPLTLNLQRSRSTARRTGLHCRSQIQLGWHLLGCAHAPIHRFGRSNDLFYLAECHAIMIQLVLALMRSINSLKEKPLSPWKLMLRDGLNLYGV